MELKKYCDHCNEEWEESFFCNKCSGKYQGTEVIESPKLIYYGCGNEMEFEEEYVFSGDVCYNCCTCHLNK
jgi:hypothetical protein